MALTERLALLVSLDAQGAIRGLNDVGKAADRNLSKTTNRIDRVAGGMQKAGVGMMAAAGLMATGLYKAGQSAANLEQAVGGTEAVFKDTSDTIDKFAKTAAQKMGLSEAAFRQATTSIGGQLKGLGFDVEDAADKAIDLTGVAADLAATYGGTTAEAVQALGAAFRGEADPAERFNLFLNQTRVNAKAVEMGLADSTSEVDANAKAQAVLALVAEQSADAQGQFARETGTAAGAMQIANAEFENAKAALGESVAPIMASVAEKVSALASGFSKLNEESGGAASELAGFATIGLAAAGGLSFVIGKAIDLRRTVRGLSGAAGVFAGMGTAIAGLAAAWQLYDSSIRSARAAGAGEVAGLKEQFDPQSMQELRDTIGGLTGDIQDASVEAGKSDTWFWDNEKLATLNAGIDAGKEWRDQLIDQQRAAMNLANEMGVTEDEALRLIMANEDTAEAAGIAGGAFDGEAAAASALVTQLTEAKDALTALFDPVFAMEDALNKEAEAQWAVGEAIAEFGADSPEAIKAQEDLARAVVDTDGAALLLNATMKENPELMAQSRQKLDEWVASGRLTEDQAAVIAWNIGEATGKANEYSGTYKATLEADTEDAEAKITWLDTLVANLRWHMGAAGVGGSVTIPNRNPDAMRAAGGPVSAGRTYLVGERGPELLTMGAAGNVTPNNRLGVSTTDASTIVNLTVNGNVDRPVLADMAYALRRVQMEVVA